MFLLQQLVVSSALYTHTIVLYKFITLPPVQVQSIVTSMPVQCTCSSKTTGRQIQNIFCACCLWLCLVPPLMTVQWYVLPDLWSRWFTRTNPRHGITTHCCDENDKSQTYQVDHSQWLQLQDVPASHIQMTCHWLYYQSNQRCMGMLFPAIYTKTKF